MNCWRCDSELVWQGDYDMPDHDEDEVTVTHLDCPRCDAHVEVYLP